MIRSSHFFNIKTGTKIRGVTCTPVIVHLVCAVASARGDMKARGVVFDGISTCAAVIEYYSAFWRKHFLNDGAFLTPKIILVSKCFVLMRFLAKIFSE